MKNNYPLFKEYRLDILQKCLDCFDKIGFDREKQRACVLENYNIQLRNDLPHWDKSVFRGMVIPSLKYLGLLYGSKDELIPTANGKILLEANNCNKNEEVLRAIIFDLDKNVFKFLETLKHKRLSKEEFFFIVSQKSEYEKKKPLIERINKWLSILAQVKLIVISSLVECVDDNISNVEKITDLNNFDISVFNEILLSAYKELARGNAGIIKIEDLRRNVLLKYLFNQKSILISSTFDKLFTSMNLINETYLISLGKPRGAKERLLFYKNNYYNTIHIKFNK